MGAGTLAALGPVMLPIAASAAESDARAKLLRWDLVAIRDGVVVPGGTDVGRDSATEDTVSLTGSGQAEPHEGEASGGGTFVHKDSLGNVRASGVYIVTGFRKWRDGQGSLIGVGVRDGIGELDEADSGILTLGVQLIPDSGSPHDGELTVNCNLPGTAFAVTEGIMLTVRGTSLDFTPHGGGTLFHVLEGGSSE
jgi:hypothetical protein